MTRSEIRAIAAMAWACLASIAYAGTPAASIVSFEWRTTGDASASTQVSCAGCGPNTSDCTNNPVSNFVMGGLLLTETSEARQAGRHCNGACGGAGVASADSQANGLVFISEPTVSPEGIVYWTLDHTLSVQVQTEASTACGGTSAAAQAESTHFWDIIFDLGPGPTLVTLEYQHVVSDNEPGTHSTLTIGNQDISFFSDSITGAPGGGGTHSGTVQQVLPPGQYHFRLDAETGQTVPPSASESDFSLTSGVFGLEFRHYACPSVVTNPQPVSTCTSGTAAVSVTASGIDISYQWQIEDAGAPGGWLNAVDGLNATSFGQFTVTGAQTASAVFSAFPTQWSQVDFDTRVIVNSLCSPSDAATITVFHAGGGDGNASGATNGNDIRGFADAVVQGGTPSASYCAYDMNLDGTVNMSDLVPFVSNLLI